jgi:hypothetical protein
MTVTLALDDRHNETEMTRISSGGHLSIDHKLLTRSWTSDVEALEASIGRFAERRPLTNACRVVFFEIAGDAHLHVNVTLRHQTTAARGWAGPAKMPEGFVHNRMFGATPSGQMLRHIREMVFAERM